MIACGSTALSKQCVVTSFCKPSVFFFNDTATTEIYTLSLHDALPIFAINIGASFTYYYLAPDAGTYFWHPAPGSRDRKSTRLNSSHVRISYSVFCLTKKTETTRPRSRKHAK